MANVNDVANFFLAMSEPDEGDMVSNLKLQKLCYYAQGFSLALTGQPLFDEALEAWEHGPVVPPLYRRFREYGSGGIPVSAGAADEDGLTAEERDLLTEVWNVYGQFSAWKLRNMTHEEPPWLTTPRNAVIAHDKLREFFRTRVSA